ncbi:MAG: carbohydrate ABC transporter permease [Eubacteriales bacterium]|nr:carbohydrate ABC transporter permease [Eubacteriales bacterium]MDD3880861.1 carbohydrate ABC transporter permease [Eubacteriales bacterium]MDD4511772.1 carbohydrate ABC transporter permease [Eubacteriales bacterium]
MSTSKIALKHSNDMRKGANPIIYIVCIILGLLSLFPFWVMVCNATRSTYEIQAHAISFLPSVSLPTNYEILNGKTFNAVSGFFNSLIVSTGVTFCSVYFSTLTAFALIAYNWKLRQAFFTLILAVMMIPAQVISIGFYQFMYKIGMTNNFLALILPAIASPMTVFFMRQYMLPALSLDLVAAGRIDGAGEFRIFNQIVIPIMKPAMATQAIFAFVNSWNELFLPMILLTRKENYTMPIMVSLLKGDIYKTEYGAVYLALTLSVLPLLVVYLTLSKYIVAGVALGSVKG